MWNSCSTVDICDSEAVHLSSKMDIHERIRDARSAYPAPCTAAPPGIWSRLVLTARRQGVRLSKARAEARAIIVREGYFRGLCAPD